MHYYTATLNTTSKNFIESNKHTEAHYISKVKFSKQELIKIRKESIKEAENYIFTRFIQGTTIIINTRNFYRSLPIYNSSKTEEIFTRTISLYSNKIKNIAQDSKILSTLLPNKKVKSFTKELFILTILSSMFYYGNVQHIIKNKVHELKERQNNG